MYRQTVGNNRFLVLVPLLLTQKLILHHHLTEELLISMLLFFQTVCAFSDARALCARLQQMLGRFFVIAAFVIPSNVVVRKRVIRILCRAFSW